MSQIKQDDLETLPVGPTAFPWRSLERASVSRYGMVATAHHCATEVGIQMLSEGGNAVDAAIAAAFALCVCEPAASGLGGQTLMLIYHAPTLKKIALDGSSRAPYRALPNSLTREEVRTGYKAATVPSTPAVLDYALRNYGSMELKRVLEPAIRLADEGYDITPLQRSLTKRTRRSLKAGPAAALFLIDNKKSPQVGHRFCQPALAETLRRIARRGVEEFYKGSIAVSIHRDMNQNDGLIRKDDLAQIPWPIVRRPITCRMGSDRLFTMPPPGAGRTLIEMLNIFNHLQFKHYNPDKSSGAVFLAEVIRRAFIDRRDRPFDPNFYAQVEERRMLDLDYAKKIARQTRNRIRGYGETTHVSVMDRNGSAVALTQSIENVFGACVASKELGFLYNNYMNAFEYTDLSHPYYMRPGAVPWASVAPTIIFRGRRPWLVIGSTGSDRITPSILQVLVRLLHGYSLYEAIAAPRLHCSLGGKVSLELDRMNPNIVPKLEKLGFSIDARDPYSFYMGCVQAVQREGRLFHGAADPRRDGSAGGPRI
ncbi:MAG: gamma-glutamyltransferase [Candidatus Latescibacteria bacterium]|nr:gamma-glutamyltransferase [Candidatus Latescibacterota bacterium]NIO57349.1 gamma-glutamyltransferase [Candidatus Latescibacterota bacterium]